MKNIFFLILGGFACSLNSCGQNTNELGNDFSLIFYQKQKANFDSALVSHFPQQLKRDSSECDLKLFIDSNNVSFTVYEYSLNEEEFVSKVNQIKHFEIHDKFKPSDTCVIVIRSNLVNKTGEFSGQKSKRVLNLPCIDILPIPDFQDYNESNSKLNSKLDNDFDLILLDRRAGVYFEKYQKKPKKLMPKGWENGLAKGVAINHKKRTLIYWLVLW